MRDAWRLCVGTFTALPTRPPSRVGARTWGGAMLFAPVTVLPAAAGWVGLALLTTHALMPYAVAAVLALVVTALLTRALHLDGLADFADGLTSGHDHERSLEVMRRGNTGPAGAAALVLVLGLDAACLAALLTDSRGAVLAVTALVASRLAPAICARHGIPAARPAGLGHGVAGTVTRRALVGVVFGVSVGAATVAATVAEATGDELSWWSMPLGAAVVAVAGAGGAVATRRHAVRRLGGVTGDVIGAAMEVGLAAALVIASVAHTAM
ncbi:adenosylcobinamide-GDP ribazoletransferase [Humibacillus xanthopallidus]|uniref:adenosylcobinamide-GDP ribazoletransferase n=1 Tax=Humibacillus xanthopallidus TaxID=412689 RepID=UPI00384D140E